MSRGGWYIPAFTSVRILCAVDLLKGVVLVDGSTFVELVEPLTFSSVSVFASVFIHSLL